MPDMKKSISIRDALGLKDLYTEQGSTEFCVKISAFIPSSLKQQWLESRLPEWKHKLVEIGNILDADLTVKPPYDNLLDGSFDQEKPDVEKREYFGFIVITIKVAGSINSEKTPKPLMAAIMDSAKQELSKMLLIKCPPPFECLNPLLPTNSEDILEIRARKLHDEKLADKLIEKLRNFFEGKNASLGFLDFSPKNDYFKYSVVWHREMSDSERNEICKDIRDIFFELTNFMANVKFFLW